MPLSLGHVCTFVWYNAFSCALAPPGVRRGAADAAVESSACGRRNAVGLTSILDRRQFLQCSRGADAVVRVGRVGRVRRRCSGLLEENLSRVVRL